MSPAWWRDWRNSPGSGISQTDFLARAWRVANWLRSTRTPNRGSDFLNWSKPGGICTSSDGCWICNPKSRSPVIPAGLRERRMSLL
jgi:hypothetical protein